MTAQTSTRGSGRPRRLAASALVAVMVALLLSVMPGIATAAPPQIVPLINCQSPHSDGSTTVVLGYESRFSTTRTIPHGSKNYTTPASYGASLPKLFDPGTHNGVATLRIASHDLTPSTSWYLDGYTLPLAPTADTPTCTQAQLPAFANGAAIAGVLLVAGLVGVVVVRRMRRNLLQPRATNTPAAGRHRA